MSARAHGSRHDRGSDPYRPTRRVREHTDDEGSVSRDALAWLVTLGDPSLPETDWEIVAEAGRFEMLLDEDLELLFALEVLEAWDGSEEI